MSRAMGDFASLPLSAEQPDGMTGAVGLNAAPQESRRFDTSAGPTALLPWPTAVWAWGEECRDMDNAQRATSLDGLRGIAACAVLAYHCGLAMGGDPLHYGLLGVDLFFVISGHVIYLTLARRGNLWRFAIGRVARLFPAYWVSVLLGALLFVPQGQASVWQAAVNLTMLQRLFGVRDVIDVYWTLALELWFYFWIALAVATGCIRRVESVCLVWLSGMTVLRLAGATVFARPIEVAFAYATMIHFGHLFIAGMMVFRLRHGGGRLAWATLALALAYALFGRADWAGVPAAIYFPVVCAFVALVWDATGPDRLVRLLSAAPVRFLGSISYSLYLVHALVLAFALQVMPRAATAVALAVPASILLAWGLRLGIELPGQA